MRWLTGRVWGPGYTLVLQRPEGLPEQVVLNFRLLLALTWAVPPQENNDFSVSAEGQLTCHEDTCWQAFDLSGIYG